MQREYWTVRNWVATSFNSRRGKLLENLIIEFQRSCITNSDTEILDQDQICSLFKAAGKSREGIKFDWAKIDTLNKTIELGDSKSNGVAGNDKGDVKVSKFISGIKSIQELYPDFKIKPIICRPNGKAERAFTEAGISTVKTSALLGGAAPAEVVYAHEPLLAKKVIADAIRIYKPCQTTIDRLNEEWQVCFQINS